MFLQKWSKPLTMAALLVSSSLYAASNPAVEAKNGMVVTSQHLASQVGVDILKLGGNAIDAAVAVGYAQAVVNPCCGNIGGGGFMTVHLADGTDTFINFRETAPAAANANMYLDAEGNVKKGASLYGYLAAGVPGTVLGMETARVKYGKLSREQVMAPAIKLAREGFILTRADTDILDTTVARFKQDPESAKIFLRADGTPLQPGDRLVQSDLANTLTAIAKEGPDAFYKGKIPQAVEAAAKQGGGILTAADFANYKVTETPPITCSYRGYKFVSAPPPSSGGVTLCEILNVVEGYDLKSMGFNSAAAIHTMTEAMRHAYMDRNTYLGDPEFIKNPIDRLVSKSYAEEIRKKIVADKATPSENVQPGMEPHEKPETTHYSIVDHDGNAVSTTYTVNGRFGAVVIAPGTGFFLNDEMDDFTVKVGEKNLYGLVQGTANSIAPGKRPLSSMSPTLVTKDNKIFMVLGSPGGSRIITITLQTALNVIDHGMAPQEAVDAPRIHHQWLPDEVYYEQRGVSADTLKILAGMGYKMVEQTPWGAAELILVGLPGAAGVSPANSGNDSAVSGKVREGYLYGANDVRRPAGSAVGY
ncbi:MULTISPECIES: gamma-glutamyltransferase [Serratia]|jgi:gamma-glutamyltranspeptidase / glutathione hydrolase|uniref:Glutathione hydrolase proenzyme n=1 Tax=Serratia liquefaciens TaxID=614 RepID=A0ABX7D0S4_SERLI|nr:MULTISPECIES: gamma-glutamyltransferase [Serratia]AKE11825.1 gamma-glutamyltransferase [Serratia liquefaciens]AYO36517.1 gamma-glutamyltransferase [Serratia sp. P2ACOL2]MBI6160786.1 gamma-glutamyltransferase [Serratia liquefaciens]MCS4319783.1 gamma-glutamyltranspeptidase/glutathione hydrolase [Serratia sp. BIGb0234]MDU3889512.1 gamma-glutamyltransferase [Serratia liquefaciens]